MSEEKKETKCCGSCKNAKKELSNEDLDKVTGGNGWQDGKYICVSSIARCSYRKKVDGVANVCTCSGKTNGKCHVEYGDSCTCQYWDSKTHRCTTDFS